MVEEKKDKVQELRKRRRASRGASTWLIVAGFVALFVVIVFNFGVSTFEDTKHLSTPNIPLKDAENATYSFTAEEVKDQNLVALVVGMIIAVAFIAAGYTILFVNPGERELHMVHCKGSTEGNYCPECGMNLKKMEKYKWNEPEEDGEVQAGLNSMMETRTATQLRFIWGEKIPSTRFQCSNCGVMVGRFEPACKHCGADLR